VVKKITKLTGNVIASVAKQSSRLIFPMLVISLLLTNPTHALETASTTHTIKLNIYDSTSLITILDFCDQVKADQEENNTYTEESYDALMEECDGGRTVLECLETALDASKCEDPDEKTEDIEDAIENLEPLPPTGEDPESGDPTTPTTPTTPRPDNKALPPNTGSTWYTTILGKDYAIPVVSFVILSIAMLSGITLTIFLIRRHIKDKGIGRVKISNPWSKDSYKAIYQKNLVNKHEDDPLTEIIDVSNIVKKYRIKYVLWHTVPVLAIVGAFIALVLVTSPTTARGQSEYADITLTAVGGNTLTIVNVDKATAGDPVTRDTGILAINTDIHNGGLIDSEGGVYAKYTAHSTMPPNMSLTTQQTTPANNPLPNVTLTNTDQLIIPSVFDSTDIDGENTFAHMVAMTLSDVSDIPTGSYVIELIYTLTANEPISEPPIIPITPLTTGCGAMGNNMGRVESMQTFVDTWDIYDYGVATDSRNGQDYYICKLPDEHVWMLNNLKISLFDVADNPELSNAGINISALETQTVPSTSGSSYDQPLYYDPPGSTSDITDETFYGYLYNWCAATGGTTTTCKAGAVPDNATTDICPANWRLPMVRLANEFAWLNAKMNNPSATAPHGTSSDSSYVENWQFTGPFQGVFSGRWSGDVFNSQGTHGDFWSSNRDSQGFALYLGFSSSVVDSVDSGTGGTRTHGYAIRCLLGNY